MKRRGYHDVNWGAPTADDIAAGLSAEQAKALLTCRPGDDSGSLLNAVPDWRAALLVRAAGGGLTYRRTPFGDDVAAVLASGIEARQRPDPAEGLDPKGESPIANGETP